VPVALAVLLAVAGGGAARGESATGAGGAGVADIVIPHMEYARNGGSIVLHSSVARFPGDFLLTTSFPVPSLDERFRAVLRLRDPGVGAAQPQGMDRYVAPDRAFGPWTVAGGEPCMCLSFGQMSQTAGVDVAGLLGLRDIEGKVVIVDDDADTLTISATSPAVDPAVPEAVLPFAPVPPDQGLCVDLTVGGRPTRFLVRTADNGSLGLTAELYDALDADGAITRKAASLSTTLNGIQADQRGLVSGLRCGPFAYPSVMVVRDRPVAAGGLNTIGTRFLARHNVVIDLVHGVLRLRQRNPAITAPDRVNTTGAWIWVGAGGGIEVHHVTPDSPAASAGLLAGDVLRSVNGKAVADCSLTQVRLMIEGYPEQALDLKIERPADHSGHDIVIAAGPGSATAAADAPP
jgi:hypothetical protein